ncbi:hypothetical protein BTN50_0037 [Candidatus Enterovibrio altilux]|uniref:Uncharacterized protein n=1 Tax=Candidatus Enterovibrio altilux TaxID=1927128 RepID=A0A291B6F8_9GAMM|nr:hypothetical protein BTN50_0037 [Candidatus Enterovibrio luxaltus]
MTHMILLPKSAFFWWDEWNLSLNPNSFVTLFGIVSTVG